MDFKIYTNEYKSTIEMASKLRDGLKKIGWKESDKSKNVFAIGGDGTVLNLIKEEQYRLEELILTAIHSGGLGFYADFKTNNILEIIETITMKKPTLSKINTIKVFDGKKTDFFINEFQIMSPSKPSIYSIALNTFVLQKFRSSGLIISTPTGSTGAMKSFGGAIVDPELKALEIFEIAACSNNIYRSLGSPVIVASDKKITISANFENSKFSGDGRTVNLKPNKNIEIRLGKSVTFARYDAPSFFERVHDSFVMEGKNNE